MQAAMPLACFLSMIRPPGIQFENSLLQIAPVDKAKCPFVRDHNDIEFRLYTRHNPTVYQELYIDDDEKLFASNLDYHAPTVLFFHAFMENPDDGSAAMVREAYVLRGDTNVIMVDASRLEAGPWYFTAAENTWYIGKFAAQFVDYLVSRGLNLNNTHFVGHSLGAQAAGVAGSALKTGRVSRITGLDPALPLFHGLPPEQRLDTSDADFVDIIHTDGGIFGVNRPMGHADFYPNGGISPQPGCELEVVIPQQMLLNKCDTNAEPRGLYAFYLTPKITKNSLILENKLQKFFTRIQALKSHEQSEGKPLNVDKRGLEFLKIESQSPTLIKVDTFDIPIKTSIDIEEKVNIELRKLNLETSERYSQVRNLGPRASLKTEHGLQIKTSEPHDSLETRDPDAKEKKLQSREVLKIKNTETHENLKTDPEDNLDTKDSDYKVRKPKSGLKIGRPVSEDSLKTRDPDSKQRKLETRESRKIKYLEAEGLKIEKLKDQEILKSTDIDSINNFKTRHAEPKERMEVMVEPQESQNPRHIDASDQTVIDDQIMVESIKKYRVIKPDFFTKDDFNTGTMKPIINKENARLFVETSDDSKEIITKKDEKVTESGEVDSHDKTQRNGIIFDVGPLRLDLDRYLMPPRIGRYYRNFATKEDISKIMKEVTITQMPPYFNQGIRITPEDKSKIQTRLNSENKYYENFKQGKQNNKLKQYFQEPIRVALDESQYQSQTDIDSQQKVQVDSFVQDRQTEEQGLDKNSQGKSQVEYKDQTDSKIQKEIQFDSKSQQQTQLESETREQSKVDSESREQSQIDSNSQQHSQLDSRPAEQSQIDTESRERNQTNSKINTVYKNHVIKRQKRFLNPFKSAETDPQDNFLLKLLDFVFKHRSKTPVYSVMREINTLVKSAHGELNHISKERNNYIGAPPPTLIPVTYTLELANENKVTAFVKKLLGLAPKGDRLTINGK